MTLLLFLGFICSCTSSEEEQQVVSDSVVAPTEQWENPKDRSLLRLIPSGTYLLGSSAGDMDEGPPFEYEAVSFWIAETEVTNEKFSLFLNEVSNGRESVSTFVEVRGVFPRPSEIVRSKRGYRPSYGYEEHPVMTASYEGARAYCEWARLRLPSELEWEIAARGGLQGKAYPWGNEQPSSVNANFGRTWKSGQQPAPTTEVRHFPANSYGLYDMSGNVYEWTATEYAVYGQGVGSIDAAAPDQRVVVRGGSWGSDPYELRVSFRRNYVSKTRSNFVGGLGFRCAKDATQ